MTIPDAQIACFEAGIKFGSLYHQFTGTPVTPASSVSLERAIEAAIENQPYCTSVTVDIHVDDTDLPHGYAELTGQFMDVELSVTYDSVDVTARMTMEDGYPRMRVVSVDA